MVGKAPEQQTFNFETVAVVLCCMLKSGVTLGTAHYEMMSRLDGKRGKDAFQHQFRKVKARAQELLFHLEEDTSTTVGVTLKPRKKHASSTPRGTKRESISTKRTSAISDESDRSDDIGSTPKKVKTEGKYDLEP